MRNSNNRPSETNVEDPLTTVTHWLYRRIARYIGYGGLVIVVLAVTIIWNWDEILTRAPVRWAREQAAPRHELPKASGKRITIAIADLENDPSGAHGRVLQTAVARRKGVEVILLKRKVVMLNTDRPQEDWARGHELARQMMRETHANVVIWGTALSDDPEGPMSLHWTLPSQDQSTVCPITYRPNDSDFDLPNLFWDNLRHILAMLVATQANQLAGDNAATEDTEQFIERVRTLLSGTSPGPDRVLIQVSFARALALHAERNNDLAAFREIIAIDRALLPGLSDKKNSALRTLTQRQLGIALFRVGSASSDESAMRDSVAAFRATLAGLPRAAFPADHAAAQSNLSVALIGLSQMKKDPSLARQAITASRTAVTLTSPERSKQAWSRYQINFATALGVAGKMSEANTLLEEAIQAFAPGLASLDSQSQPVAWGDAQFQYGLALYFLASRTHHVQTLAEAAGAFMQVVVQQRPERRSHHWMDAQKLLAQTVLLTAQYGRLQPRLPCAGGSSAPAGLFDRATVCFRQVLPVGATSVCPLAGQKAPFRLLAD